jgi:hypothetical protein
MMQSNLGGADFATGMMPSMKMGMGMDFGQDISGGVPEF